MASRQTAHLNWSLEVTSADVLTPDLRRSQMTWQAMLARTTHSAGKRVVEVMHVLLYVIPLNLPSYVGRAWRPFGWHCVGPRGGPRAPSMASMASAASMAATKVVRVLMHLVPMNISDPLSLHGPLCWLCKYLYRLHMSMYRLSSALYAHTGPSTAHTASCTAYTRPCTG